MTSNACRVLMGCLIPINLLKCLMMKLNLPTNDDTDFICFSNIISRFMFSWYCQYSHEMLRQLVFEAETTSIHIEPN